MKKGDFFRAANAPGQKKHIFMFITIFRPVHFCWHVNEGNNVLESWAKNESGSVRLHLSCLSGVDMTRELTWLESEWVLQLNRTGVAPRINIWITNERISSHENVLEAPRHREDREFLQVTLIQGIWGLLTTILSVKKLSGIACKTWSVPSVQTQETKIFLWKSQEGNQLPAQWKRETLNADLAEHLIQFLLPYRSLWSVVTDHFSSALLNPCPSFNSALSYLYFVWRTCFTKSKGHTGLSSVSNPLMCQAAVWLISFFSELLT